MSNDGHAFEQEVGRVLADPRLREIYERIYAETKALGDCHPGRASVADEAEIRSMLRHAAKSRVWLAPPYLLAKLLDGGRLLAELLDRERQEGAQLVAANRQLIDENARLVSFVLGAEERGWINRHERDVLLNLRDDPAALRRLTTGRGDP